MLSLGHIFAAQGELTEAKAIYSRALAGFQALLGPSSDNCRRLERALASLNPQQGKLGDFLYPLLGDVSINI